MVGWRGANKLVDKKVLVRSVLSKVEEYLFFQRVRRIVDVRLEEGESGGGRGRRWRRVLV